MLVLYTNTHNRVNESTDSMILMACGEDFHHGGEENSGSWRLSVSDLSLTFMSPSCLPLAD